MSDKKAPESVPTGKIERGAIAAKAGLKVGSNYARYLARRAVSSGDGEEARAQLHTKNAEDLLSQLVKLRGTALKLAQGMSLEPGLLPREFGDIMAKAQYQVPPMSAGLVRRLVRQNLGGYPEEVFASFEAEAVAAASLGQVHRAVMHDGTVVAVKVQYPNVRESIDSDLRVARGLAERFVGKNMVDPYLEEVRGRLLEETDYLQEGENIRLFRGLYTSDKIVTPEWIPELTTSKVLTMTFVEGLHLRPFLDTNPSQEVRDAIGQVFFDFVHSQVAADNLTVHADAHPGNFLFREDGTVGVLDFGLVKRFPREFRDGVIRLFKSRLEDDEASLLESYEELELLRPDQTPEQREFLIEVLDKFGCMIATPYRNHTFDFGAQTTLDGYEEVFARLTGRDAYKHRGPVGSPQFVFVSRLLVGFLSIMSQLKARVDVRTGREMVLDVVRRHDAGMVVYAET